MRALALLVGFAGLTSLLAPAALAQPTPEAVVGFAERGDLGALADALDAGADPEAPAEVEGAFGGPLTPLMAAARQDRADAIGLLLRAGADVDATDEKGNTALRWAADGHAADAARLLLDAGADPAHANDEGTTAAGWAALRGADAVLVLLLDAGASTSGLLSQAVQTYGERHGGAATIALLLDRGASPDEVGQNGWTPLYRAADNTPGGLLVTRLLLDAGADRDAPNTGTTPASGRTPAERVREMDGPIQALYDGAPEATAQAGLLAAVLRGESDAAVGWVTRGADPNAGTRGTTFYGDDLGTDDGGPLHLAALAGAPAAVIAALVAAGADPDGVSMAGFPPLKVAADRGDLAMVRALLDAGATADGGDARPLMGMEPIHWAAISGSADVVRALLDAGADPGYTTNASMGYGYNALGFAIHHGHAEAVRVLLDAGADPAIAGETRATPLDLAEDRGWTAIADLLRQRGAPTSAEAAHARADALLAEGPEAAWDEASRDPDLIRVLLDRDVPVPASFALDAVVALVEAPDLVAPLTEAGADVNARGDDGWTALHVAAADGRGPLVAALLDAGADPALTTAYGETARELAEASGDDETLAAFDR